MKKTFFLSKVVGLVNEAEEGLAMQHCLLQDSGHGLSWQTHTVLNLKSDDHMR